jgi:hypothetical protein
MKFATYETDHSICEIMWTILKKRPKTIIISLLLLLVFENVSSTFAAGGGSKGSSTADGSQQTGNGASGQPTGTAPGNTQGQGGQSVTLGGSVMAYRSLKELGDLIAKTIADTNDLRTKAVPAQTIKKVYITTVPPNAGNAQAAYFYIKFSFDALIKAYEKQDDFVSSMDINSIKNNVAFSPETFSDIANAAATILSLFRTSITTSANAIPPDNLGFIPNLCMGLKKAKMIPVTMDINFDNTDLNKGDTLVHAMSYAARLRAAGATYVGKPSPPNKSAIDTLNAAYDALSTNMTAQPLANLVQLDLLHLVSQDNGNYVLYVTNNYAIGESRVKSNPVVDIFFDGPRTSFVGGAGISYFLFYGENFDLICADHLDGYSGYNRFSKTGWPMVPNALDLKPCKRQRLRSPKDQGAND